MGRFEIADVRRRRFDKAVWIPIRASQTIKSGKFGRAGFKEEFFGLGSLAIPLRKRSVSKNCHGVILAGGPFKPGFGLSGAVQSRIESSCRSFVFRVVYPNRSPASLAAG
jgi:hypothetical protein